ncbi:MAG: CPBP family intramembrane metalloprotease [Acidimicrobiia bacterium]|nr:CPBP family intramembrane metalloprotease [Acidimicrobiia bacterium]
MTESIGGSTVPPPPIGSPVSTVPPPRPRLRPWWGLGDILLGLPVIVATAIAGLLIGLPFLTSGERTAMFEGASDLPSAVLATSLLGQQLGQGLWPVLVAKWKGLGPVRDWRLAFKPVDVALGFGTAIIALGVAAAAAAIASELVSLTDESAADNTEFLRTAEGTPWFYVLLAAVVVGAPFAEELFFRGLALRAFEKRAGPVAAVVGSTVLFTLPHFIGSGLEGTVVLFASIGAVGAVLGTITIVVGRLWPAIFAHVVFNSIGAAGALGAFDGLAGT